MRRLFSFAPKPPSSLKMAVLGVSLAWLQPTLFDAAQAQAASVQKSYSIAPGPLGQVLGRFASESGVILSFDTALTAGKQSQGLSGTYSIEQGFARLLAGSELAVTAAQDGSYLLYPAPQTGAMQLGPTNVNGTGLGETTENTGSYATRSVILGKAPATLRETPQSVSVITRQRMDDQSLTTLHDVLAQTPGVSIYQTSMHTSRYIARGAEITSYRVDGGAPTDAYAFGGGKELDMAMYDRVEVLRGVDGLFSGAGEPGGSVNLVRKRPTAQAQVKVESSIGSWNSYREMLDVNGPLALDGKLRGRSVLVAHDSDMFYDQAHMQTRFFYGVLEADLSDSTTVLAGMTYNDYDKSDQTYGIVRGVDGADLHLSRSTYLAGAKDRMVGHTNSYFLRLDHQLNDNWVASLDLIHSQDRPRNYYYAFSGAVRPDGSGVGATAEYQAPPNYSRAVDFNIKGDSQFMGLNQNVVLGWDWSDTHAEADYYEGSYREIPDIYSFDPDDYLHDEAKDLTLSDEQRVLKYGVYGSWRLQLADPLHVIVGGRYSSYKNYYGSVEPDGYQEHTSFADRRVFTPFVGATYDLSPQWTAYVSAGEIYKSQANYLSASGSPLAPITGTTYEIGVKGELFDGRLTTNAALYYTERDGQAVQAYRGTGNCCYLDNGHMTTQGVDLEISGELFTGLQASAGYTYNQVSNSIKGSLYNSLTPKHQFKLFAAYQLPGVFSALKIGAGVTAQSTTSVNGTIYERNASGDYVRTSNLYSFDQAGYAIWNAFADYRINKHWSLGLNANNLFDKRYYTTVGHAEYGNFYGDPKNFVLTLRGSY